MKKFCFAHCGLQVQMDNKPTKSQECSNKVILVWHTVSFIVNNCVFFLKKNQKNIKSTHKI